MNFATKWIALAGLVIALPVSAIISANSHPASDPVQPDAPQVARAAEVARIEERRVLDARHAAWRHHEKDVAFGALSRASGCGMICVTGSTGDEIDADAEALVDQEEAAHPDAWKSYEPD